MGCARLQRYAVVFPPPCLPIQDVNHFSGKTPKLIECPLLCVFRADAKVRPRISQIQRLFAHTRLTLSFIYRKRLQKCKGKGCVVYLHGNVRVGAFPNPGHCLRTRSWLFRVHYDRTIYWRTCGYHPVCATRVTEVTNGVTKRLTVFRPQSQGTDIGGASEEAKTLARELDCHVLVPEYPGYGRAEGIANEDTVDAVRNCQKSPRSASAFAHTRR